jgi:hypothetical protein
VVVNNSKGAANACYAAAIGEAILGLSGITLATPNSELALRILRKEPRPSGAARAETVEPKPGSRPWRCLHGPY